MKKQKIIRAEDYVGDITTQQKIFIIILTPIIRLLFWILDIIYPITEYLFHGDDNHY